MTSIENTESQPQCGTIHEEISDPGSEDISTVVINSNGGQLNELPNNELLNPTNSDMNKHWHLRNIVSQYLGIKSVFPSALSDSKTIITSRCMLARKIAEEHLTCATDKTFEDVLVQYREDQIPSEIDESSSTEIEQVLIYFMTIMMLTLACHAMAISICNIWSFIHYYNHKILNQNSFSYRLYGSYYNLSIGKAVIPQIFLHRVSEIEMNRFSSISCNHDKDPMGFILA